MLARTNTLFPRARLARQLRCAALACPSQFRVEDIAQSIAEEIKSQDDEKNHHPWGDG